RRAGRAAGVRGAPRLASGDLGRVPDPLALRARGARVRRDDVDRPRGRPRSRPQGDPAKPRRGDRRGGSTGGRVMYALYSAIALFGLVLFWLPVAVLRKLTRGVALNVRARLARDTAGGVGPTSGWVHAVSVGEAIRARPPVGRVRPLHPGLPHVR